LDFRGTVLSRVQGPRTLSASFDGGNVTLNLYRGAVIGCYNCHNGPANDNRNNSTPPVVGVVSGSTPNNLPLTLPVTVTPSTATLRIISQPASGSLGISNNVLTYFPEAGFVGGDQFTYAAYDGSHNSTLATGTVSVVQGPFSIGVVAHVPTNSPAGWPVAFAAVPSVTNYSGPVTFSWNFGDGSAAVPNQFPAHTFNSAGTYSWSVTATASNAVAVASGNIQITGPVSLSAQTANGQLAIAWPASSLSGILEESADLGANADWTLVTNSAVLNGAYLNVTVQPDGAKFFRVRQAW
jgi:hypothetical protein